MKKILLAIFFILVPLRGIFAQGNVSGGVSKGKGIWKEKRDKTTDLINAGVAQADSGDFRKAIDTYNKALELALQAPVDSGSMVNIYNDLGVSFSGLGEQSLALKNYFKALKIQEMSRDTASMGRTLAFIGLHFYQQRELSKALDYYKQSLQKNLNNRRKEDVAGNYNNMGLIYLAMKDSGKAIIYFLKGAEICKSIDDKRTLMQTQNNLASLYQAVHDYVRAREQYERSLSIAKELGNRLQESIVLGNLGTLLMATKDFVTAEKKLLEALSISRDLDDLEGVVEVSGNLSQLYEQTGNEGKALEYFRQSVEAKDTLDARAKERDAQKEELNYEHEKEKLALKKEQEKQDALSLAEKTRQRNVLYFVCVVLLLGLVFIVLLYNRFKIIKEQKNIIEEQKRGFEQKNIQLERLSIVASETENVILIMGADGTLEWVNDSFVRLNAIGLEELKKLKGNTIFEISNNPNIRKIIEESVRDKKTISYESLNKTRDGKTIWESSTLTPIFGPGGELRKLIIIDTDVTARKIAEEEVIQKNKDIVDSINYARRIQYTLLAHQEVLKQNIGEHFVLFKPKDIVSGDFYWATKRDNRFYMAVCDSTGHGVPGAFMSLLNISFLNEAINEKNIAAPNEIFNYTRERLIASVSQEGAQDGMDGVLICFEETTTGKRITYAAAHNSPVIIQNNALKELPADKMPVGKGDRDTPFTLYHMDAKVGDKLYVYTDGYADQFGGPNGKKFKYRQLEELLLVHNHKAPDEQKQALESTIEAWRGDLEQVDDILVIGIQL